MFTTAVISLRETFETALVISVLLAYLTRNAEARAALWVWLGTGAGVVWSVLMAIGLVLFESSLSHEFEEVYEGVMMLTAAGLLSWMIVWMAAQGRTMKRSLERKMEEHVSTGRVLGIAATAFVATAREGTELVLLTHAALLTSSSPGLGLLGSGIGIAIAIGLGWILFQGSRKLPIGLFFSLTSIVLIVIAAFLLEHGLHEFMEAGVIPEHDGVLMGLVGLFVLILGAVWIRMQRRA